jgi:pre-60S factor REI1
MSAPSGTSVTCMACRVMLVGGDARTTHYRTDFHRVNLQRKVAGLPPLSEEDFALRAEVAREQAVATADRRAPRFCAVCSKKFSSERALANHISSRRHRDAARSRAPHMSPEAAAIGPITPASPGAMLSPADSDIEAEEEDALFEEEMDMEKRIAETVPFGMNECVFDGLVSDYPLANVKHMQTFGFFLPFAESLTDLNGLLEYLGQKVGIGYACVECDRSFTSVAAVQRHMVDKQHCRMTSDEDVWFEEYAPFYAFEEEGDGRSDGWEEVNEEEAAAAEAAMKGKEETGLQVATADASSSVGRPREYDETQEEEVAMILGNKVIGHRSFQRYYRQRLNAVDHREAVVINRLASELRVLGWQDKKMADPVFRTKRMNAFRHSKRNLEVGMKNYYTRKAPLRVSFSALNSGYVRILSWLFVAF